MRFSQTSPNISKNADVDPEVLQSGCAVIFYFDLAKLRKLPVNLSANFDGKFLMLIVSALFFPGFRPKLTLPNCRLPSPISHFETQFFFTPISASGGDQQMADKKHKS